VTAAVDGAQALRLFAQEKFDLVILDVMMPKASGYDVCRDLRARGARVPVLFLTAKGEEIDKVVGFKLGADDYVTKPFSNRELLARVKANLRRYAAEASAPEAQVRRIGDLVLNLSAYAVTKRDQPVALTHREFELLAYLSQRPGQVVTREKLLQDVWGYDYFGDIRTVDVTIRRLREKIEDDPSRPTYILTRRGVGYYLQDPGRQDR